MVSSQSYLVSFQGLLFLRPGSGDDPAEWHTFDFDLDLGCVEMDG